jgi:adenine-specific DNA-methyltransferase
LKISSPQPPADHAPNLEVLAQVDSLRLALVKQAALDNQKSLEQFLTPAPVAKLMSGLFENLHPPEISLLDPGAGIGSLLAAFVQQLCQREFSPQKLSVVAYEIDGKLLPYLETTLQACQASCEVAGIPLSYEIRNQDFIEDAVRLLEPGNGAPQSQERFTHTLLNPPYAKIRSTSKTRALLRQLGVETTNLYTGFMAAAALLLAPQGEFVSITPRSFCNGTYFRPFREQFLGLMSLRQLYGFESRKVFRDDAVLQETLILSAIKQQAKQDETVTVTTHPGVFDRQPLSHCLPYCEVVQPNDPAKFIRIIGDAHSQTVSQQMGRFDCTLEDLGIAVSTGRVVDFRARAHLRAMPGENTVPLIYPVNLVGGSIAHPIAGKKPQALADVPAVEKLLVPEGNYVLCKRFSAKEEKRRIVAAVYLAGKLGTAKVGFENHVNYFHQQGQGLDLDLALGLSLFLNSSLVDRFFRLFNGHTQVNATDLRSLKYPSKQALICLGEKARDKQPTQPEIDALVETL